MILAPPVVACGGCDVRLASDSRSVRAALVRGEAPVCADCRRVVQEVTPHVAERMRCWWVEESGLALDEVQSIARAVWS